MRKTTERALGVALRAGASYADVRIIQTRVESVATKNGRVSELGRGEDLGIGVRVLMDGAWGFASATGCERRTVERTAREAVRIARASRRTRGPRVRLAPEQAFVARWETPYLVDPFGVPLEDKIGLLFAVDGALRAVKGVVVAEGFMGFSRERQVFASSEGAFIEQIILTSGVGYTATASDGKDSQTRSYPNSFRGQFQTKGYELIWEWPLLEEAPRIAEEAVALLQAPQCPSGEKDLILGGQQLALQIHESCGHPAELDRVLGTEANYAGRSFLEPHMLGTFQYGSPIVNLTADSLSPGGLGTFGYDDEGVPAQRWHLVKDGVFTGYLTSRETAPLIGLPHSQGTMRADGWSRIPLIRMNNVSLVPGRWTLEEIIEDTDDGILMETNKSWSIDQLRFNFQFATEAGWEIKNGRRRRLLKNCTYEGITPEFWGACDAIAGGRDWVLWGTPNCGKGQPGQIAGTGHGAAPARFRKVKVGVGYDQ